MAAGATLQAVFFDIRDTLGVVDRKGHLVKFRPTTDQLLEGMKAVGLRIGIITNLPADVPTEQGRQMLDEADIWRYVDPHGFVTNHEAKAEKPDPAIFRFAARQMSLEPEQCLFVGENLLEVLGAQAAGMKATAKSFPPGREFLSSPSRLEPITETSSGRLAERILEEEHLVGKRIVGAAAALGSKLATNPSPLPVRAMGLLVWLTKHFIDPYHHRKEEEVFVPFAIMRGLSPAAVAFVGPEHDQGRAYFRGMEVAYLRAAGGDVNAVGEFRALVDGFVALYKAHGKKEDDVLFKAAGDLFTAADDALAVELMARIGPADVTLYYAVIGELEKEVAS